MYRKHFISCCTDIPFHFYCASNCCIYCPQLQLNSLKPSLLHIRFISLPSELPFISNFTPQANQRILRMQRAHGATRHVKSTQKVVLSSTWNVALKGNGQAPHGGDDEIKSWQKRQLREDQHISTEELLLLHNRSRRGKPIFLQKQEMQLHVFFSFSFYKTNRRVELETLVFCPIRIKFKPWLHELQQRGNQCESATSDRFTQSEGLSDDTSSWPKRRRAGTQPS